MMPEPCEFYRLGKWGEQMISAGSVSDRFLGWVRMTFERHAAAPVPPSPSPSPEEPSETVQLSRGKVGEQASAGSASAVSKLSAQAEAFQAQTTGALLGGPLGATLTLSMLQQQARRQDLDSEAVLLESLSGAAGLMSQTSGIVELPKGMPTLVIPDIHAQRDYLLKALELPIDGVKAFDLLQQGKLNLVCLGDGMHAEGRAEQRWRVAEEDHLRGRPSWAMNEEMVESLGTMKMVMDLKSAFPDHFHYLRGNHDDIKGGFYKYCRKVGESELVRDWVSNTYGPDFLQQYSDFEQSMPLVVKGEGFVCSHTAPDRGLKRAEVEARDAGAFYSLSWTDNTDWTETRSEHERLRGNLKELGAEPTDHWLIGHRKVVLGNHREQFDGQLVQINPYQPGDFVVALVPPGGGFKPSRDVISL